MKLCVLILMVIDLACSADIIDPSSCTTFPCLIFNDDFDYLDLDVWGHEITMAGGGNGEFQVYVNNRSVTYTRDGNLFIKPNLVSEWKSKSFLSEGALDIWGMHGRNERCTSNSASGCYKKGTPTDIINPIMSGRLTTLGVFSFKYGKVEVRAKLPRGAWLWPAIWLLPENFAYGQWPASGEIDIVESRGNDIYGGIGNSHAASTNHWAPFNDLNRWSFTHSSYPLTDDFHIWTLDWNSSNMTTYLDGKEVLLVDPKTNFWDFGKFSEDYKIHNPWARGDKMAPFDQKFYLIINLAIGGTGGYFPDNMEPADPAKPWKNSSPTAKADFWEKRNSWLPTWQKGEEISDSAALKVDYVRVYKMTKEQIYSKKKKC